MLVASQDNMLTGNTRAIFYHKMSTSGRTCFLKQETGEVCSFEKLPSLSQIVDPDDKGYVNDVAIHPSIILKSASETLGLPQTDMEVDTDFHEKVDVAGDCLSIYLIRFKTIDPPSEHVEDLGASFITLTEARNLSPVELELLRRAYTVIMEG